ncbi:hypothetical protein [Erysipelothrix piscisicarius]|uniref:hypothetical protein n=1 Tax=Erysipelothrix piscisicarius TaxID=2485784 RepID=UPI002F930C7B
MNSRIIRLLDSNFQTDLVEYAQLRNAIVHNRGGNEEAIAEPHDSVVTVHIQTIVSKIYNRKTVMDLVHDKPFECLFGYVIARYGEATKPSTLLRQFRCIINMFMLGWIASAIIPKTDGGCVTYVL